MNSMNKIRCHFPIALIESTFKVALQCQYSSLGFHSSPIGQLKLHKSLDFALPGLIHLYIDRVLKLFLKYLPILKLPFSDIPIIFRVFVGASELQLINLSLYTYIYTDTHIVTYAAKWIVFQALPLNKDMATSNLVIHLTPVQITSLLAVCSLV